jgi:two-component system phosphate regulon sensor histidine kinase PhoR
LIVIKRYRLRRLPFQQRDDTIQHIIRSLHEGVVLIDPSGTVLLTNSAVLNIFGLSRDVIGRSARALVRGSALAAPVEEALQGRRAEAEYARGGRAYQVLCSPAGSGALILFLDVTEKSKAEKLRREFSANVSHELKTPLTSILGYAEMLASGMAKPCDVAGFAQNIRREAERLFSLIEDIIMLSELDETETLPATEPVNLAEIVASVAETLQQKAEKYGVALHSETAALWVSGNSSLLHEMLFNIVDNSIKYNRRGGSVTIALRQDGLQVVLEVSDTGIGIPQKHQERVLERFYRVDKSRSKQTGGTGLGLSIVKHIVAVHNGTMDLRSMPDRGTTVTVKLPGQSEQP